MISQSARLTSSQRPSRSSRPVPTGARSKTSSKPSVGRAASASAAAARRDVDHDRHAAASAGALPRRSGAVEPQRPHVDLQAVLVGGPDLARARLADQGRVEQRLEHAPEVGGERRSHGLPSLNALGLPSRSSAWPAVRMKRSVGVEGEHQRLGQLAQRRLRRLVGALDDLRGIGAVPCRSVHVADHRPRRVLT